MRRRLFTVAAAVSAVLCVGACLLWAASVRSEWLDQQFGDPARVVVFSTPSKVVVRVLPRDARRSAWPTEERHWRFLGIESYTTVFGGPTRYWVAVPFWVLVTAAAAVPVHWLATTHRRRLVGRKRARAGRCPACGYDLTGNVSGTCPECGRATSRPPGPPMKVM